MVRVDAFHFHSFQFRSEKRSFLLGTHMLVLAVEVSQSAARPTMSNPVESWLKYLG